MASTLAHMRPMSAVCYQGADMAYIGWSSFHFAWYNVLALDLEGVHDVKLHHPSSFVATSNQ